MRLKIVFALLFVAAAVRADYREFQKIPIDPALQVRVRDAANASLQQLKNLKPEDLAITLVDMTNENTIGRADYHGDAPFYAASVIKLFFMTDTFIRNKFDVPDVPRAMREMIGVSDNDATAYIVDILADTEPGPDLQGRALERFLAKRRSINDDFARLGYTDISAMGKAWSFGPYGRDLQLIGPNHERSNRITTNATASLMTWIARKKAPESSLMLNFLSRPLYPTRPDENQIKGFIGETLPQGSAEWSKAGWTSTVHHDVAYIELPNGRHIVLAIFMRGPEPDTWNWLPAVARNVLTEIGVTPAPPAPAPPPCK